MCDISYDENHTCCIFNNDDNEHSIDEGSDGGINADGNMSVVAIANSNNDW